MSDSHRRTVLLTALTDMPSGNMWLLLRCSCLVLGQPVMWGELPTDTPSDSALVVETPVVLQACFHMGLCLCSLLCLTQHMMTMVHAPVQQGGPCCYWGLHEWEAALRGAGAWGWGGSLCGPSGALFISCVGVAPQALTQCT